MLNQVDSVLTQSGRTGLYVQLSYKPIVGGVQEHADQLVKHLNQLGERMVVLTLGSGAKEEAEFDATCDYQVIRFQGTASLRERRVIDNLLKKPTLFRDVFTAIHRIKPNYVVSNVLTSLVPATSIYLATRLACIPHLGFVHHIPPRSLSFRMRQSLLTRLCDVVLCVSNDTAMRIVECGAAPQMVHTVYNGLDTNEIEVWRRKSRGGASLSLGVEIPPGAPVLLTVSRLVEYKGIQRVIKAMPRVLSQVPNAQYVIVGDGSYRHDLMRLARESSARDAIVFLGAVTNAEKFAWYDRCSLFVMPSEEEGFGIVYLEANAFGKPAIGGDIMGVSEVVVHGETGLLVNPHDVDSIADAIIALLLDADEMDRLGETGRLRAIKDFTWEAAAKKLVKIVEAAL